MTETSKEKLTILDIKKKKREGEKIAMLTAYDCGTPARSTRAGVDIILNLKEQIRRLQQENELMGNLIRRTVQKHSEVPRYHSLVKVETTTLKVVEEE